MSVRGNGAFSHTVMSLAWRWVGNVCLGEKKKGRNKESVEQKQKDFTGNSAAEKQPDDSALYQLNKHLLHTLSDINKHRQAHAG